jgi:hypothetical protein
LIPWSVAPDAKTKGGNMKNGFRRISATLAVVSAILLSGGAEVEAGGG